jgi:hypothetical protein
MITSPVGVGCSNSLFKMPLHIIIDIQFPPACNITTLLLMSYYLSTAHAPVIVACPLSCPVSDPGLPLIHALHLRSDFHVFLSWVGHAFLSYVGHP